MNINNNRLMALPTITKKYSTWNMPHKHTTTIKEVGDIVPVFDLEVLPGDNIKVDYGAIFTRMTTPIFPVMDKVFLDVYFFFVPFRIMYDKFEEFCGAKPDGYGIQEQEYFIPSVYNVTYDKYDIGAYITDVVGTKITEPISSLYFKAYAMIYNEWFRDENLIQPYDVKKSYESYNYDNSIELSDVSKLQYGVGIAKACKLHDLFTSALPFTQRGPAVRFNFNAETPVLPIFDEDFKNETRNKILEKLNDKKTDVSGKVYSGYTSLQEARLNGSGNAIVMTSNTDVLRGNSFQGFQNIMTRDGIFINNENLTPFVTSGDNAMFFTNLAVAPEISFSVNELREAFAVQRYYEALARSGNRYNEYIYSIFGVDIDDNTIQRPVRLGSARFDIAMNQVIQTSSSDSVSPQGNVSGNSATFCDFSNIFNFSFKEAGALLGLVVLRTNNTYCQGLPRHLSHLRKFDFYIPQLQAIGEQGIKKKELFYSGNQEIDNEIFGYQEAFYEYRYKPSKVSGDFIDENSQSAYAPWTYTTYFASSPVLNDAFIRETGENLKRTLAVQDGPSFILDFNVNLRMSRLMPLYSVPGLIDHF